MADALNTQGIGFAVQSKFNFAIEKYMQALEYYEKDEDNSGTAAILNNIGILYSDMEDWEKSTEYYEKSLKIKEEIGDSLGMASTMNNLGVIYKGMAEYDKALENYSRCLSIERDNGDISETSSTLSNMAVVYRRLDSLTKAEQLALEAITIAQMFDDARGEMIARNVLSTINIDQELWSSALTNALIAKKFAEENDGSKELKDACHSLFTVYRTTGNNKKALENYEKYIEIRDEIQSTENQKEIIHQEYKYEYEKQAAQDSIAFAKEQEIKEIEIDKQKAEIIAKRNQQYALFGGVLLIAIFAGFMYNRFKITRKQKGIIEEAHFELEEKNQEIMDSIAYAKRIQSAILPPNKLVKEFLPNSFILYKPKDIVAGDFYWMENKDDKILFAAADCTGHGVPGAMVSVVCNNGLNRSVREYGLSDPGKILDKTREIVIAEFEKSEEEVKDGMDIALCSISGSKLAYSGAHNPLWIIRKGEIIETKADLSAVTSSQTTKNGYTLYEVKADKQPIGKFDKSSPFQTHQFDLIEGDSIYIFSDGYVDQFGGEKGKKFKPKALRELLLSVQNESMENQKKLIDTAFEKWRGKLEQIDDVCVIGVRI